jgi:hypothetical protein
VFLLSTTAILNSLEYEITRCYYNFNLTGSGNSKNNKTGTMRYIRIMVNKEFSRIMATYGVFPVVRDDFVKLHFGCFYRLYDFWINGNNRYETEAMGFVDKFRGAKSHLSKFRCFSSDLQKSLSNDSLMLNKHKRASCPMTALAPFVLVLLQSCFDNMDTTKTLNYPILQGGSVNGRCPGLKCKKKKKKGDTNGDSSDPTPESVRNPQQNVYLFAPSIRDMTPLGGLVTTDTQTNLNNTTARRGTKGVSKIGVPCGLGFGAACFFEPLDNTMKGLFKNEITTLLKYKKKAKVADDYDLSALSFDEAQEEEPVDEDDTPAPPKQARVKAGPIGDILYNECEHLQDIVGYSRYMRAYLASLPKSITSTVINDGNDGSDDGESSGNAETNNMTARQASKLREAIEEAREYNDAVFESTKRLQQEICDMATHLGLDGRTSCLSLLLHKTIQEINSLGDSIEAPNINKYLKLAAMVPKHDPRVEFCELKVKNLRQIVESFGVTFDPNWTSIAVEKVLLTDNKLETGLASVKLVGDIGNAGRRVYEMIVTEQDGANIDFANILQAQKQWMQHGWISNFQHMKNRGCEMSDFDGIKRIIWVKEDSVYKDLRRIMYNESINGSDDDDDISENDDSVSSNNKDLNEKEGDSDDEESDN